MGAQGCHRLPGAGRGAPVFPLEHRSGTKGEMMAEYLTASHHPDIDPSVEDKTQRESPSTQMSTQLTRRDFAIRTAGFGLAGLDLAWGLAPAATLAGLSKPRV